MGATPDGVGDTKKEEGSTRVRKAPPLRAKVARSLVSDVDGEWNPDASPCSQLPVIAELQTAQQAERQDISVAGLVLEADLVAKRFYDAFMWNQHFPVPRTVDWKQRPHRPNLFVALGRGAEYVGRFVVGGRVRAINSNRRVFDADLRKRVMSDLAIIRAARQPVGHSHPWAASERTGINRAFVAVAVAVGLEPYVVSRSSTRDTMGERACDGCRLPYFDKDLGEELGVDDVREDHMLIFVDVDYYTDMVTWARYARPMLLYTQVPSKAAGRYGDNSFELRKGSYRDAAGRASYSGTQLVNRVAGGATYTHPLWDWTCDSFSVVDWWGNLVTFLVESRDCPSGTRRVVACFPQSSVAWPFWCGTQYRSLKRFEAFCANIPVVDRGDGLLSVGAPGTFESYELSRLDYVSVFTKSKAAGHKYVGDVEKFLRCSENASTKEGAQKWAPSIYELCKAGWLPDGAGYVARTSSIKVLDLTPDVNHYIADSAHDDGSGIAGNEIAVAFAPPLVDKPTPAPAKVKANAATAHKLRVADTQAKFAGHVVPVDCNGFAFDFVAAVVGSRRGTVNPIDLSELEELWKRPSQREGLRHVHTMCETEPADRVARGFMKGEVGFKPRQIVNCDPQHNAPLGCFVHAIMRDLKCRFAWVGCGRTPEEVERRVNDVARGHGLRSAARYAPGLLTTTHEGDITNCDGSELRWHRERVIEPILMGLVAREYRPMLRHYLKEERAGFTVRMNEGYRYKAAWELISGTSLTTIKNILKVAFGDYLALRRAGLASVEAMDALGVYCGDDSVQYALDIPGLLELRVASLRDIGMDQKMIVRRSPDPVSFLGEYHYGAFADGGLRLPDFWRQAQKCHLTCATGIPIGQAAANKAAGALAGPTRADPLLGPWYEKVAELCPLPCQRNMTREELWALDQGGSSVAERLALRQRVVDQWCATTGVDRSQLDGLLTVIASAKTLEELPAGALVMEGQKSLLPGIDNSGSTGVAPPPPDNHVEKTKIEETRPQGRSGDDGHRSGARRGRGAGQAGATARSKSGTGGVAVANSHPHPVRGRGRGRKST